MDCRVCAIEEQSFQATPLPNPDHLPNSRDGVSRIQKITAYVDLELKDTREREGASLALYPIVHLSNMTLNVPEKALSEKVDQ
jgi:hypothetical protein